MIKEVYKNIKGRSKKTITIIDEKRNEYEQKKMLGRGGQAPVFAVLNKKEKKSYAFKMYKANSNNSKKNEMIKAVRENIIELTNYGPFKNKHGKPSTGIISPKFFVDGGPDRFGYIMDLVDLKGYITLKKAWRPGMYPSTEVLCNIVINLAHEFESIHLGAGYCYKDINEGNIYFNTQTGDIKIIDNDNLGPSDIVTIKGTPGYIAPEIYGGAKPDQRTDQFSFAVYLLRLFVGAYPFEGKYSRDYCIKKDILDIEAAPVIYGSEACFIFHPTNKRNSIEEMGDKISQGQHSNWNNLPQEIKNLFIKTFVTNLEIDRRAERTRVDEWAKVFEKMLKNLVKCPQCHKSNFHKSKKCAECSTVLPYASTGRRAEFDIISIGDRKGKLILKVSDIKKGREISRHLSSYGDFLKLQYSKSTNKLGLRNLSAFSWKITPAGKSAFDCPPGGIVELSDGMKINFLRKIAQLNVSALVLTK